MQAVAVDVDREQVAILSQKGDPAITVAGHRPCEELLELDAIAYVCLGLLSVRDDADKGIGPVNFANEDATRALRTGNRDEEAAADAGNRRQRTQLDEQLAPANRELRQAALWIAIHARVPFRCGTPCRHCIWFTAGPQPVDRRLSDFGVYRVLLLRRFQAGCQRRSRGQDGRSQGQQ